MELWVFGRSGIPIFFSNPDGVDDHQLSGFFSAISIFVEQIDASDRYSIETRGTKFLFRYCLNRQVIVAVVFDSATKEKKAIEKLDKATTIVERSCNAIAFDKFNGDVTKFDHLVKALKTV